MGLSIELILNPDKNLKLDSMNFIAVVSDIHMGAFNSTENSFDLNSGNMHILDFIQFLKKLNENKEKCKGLMILGDFFDLVTSTYDSIKNDPDIHFILEIFKKFTSNNIPIIITLGNHEIPICGDFNSNFSDRINYFIEKMDLSGWDIKFCQAAMLKLNNREIDDLQYELLNSLNSQTPNSFENKDVLLLHGFQFQQERMRNIAANRIWTPLIQEQDPVIKEMINLLWNHFLFEDRPIEEIEYFLDQYFDKLQENGDIWYQNKKKVMMRVRLFKFYKYFRKKRNNNRYNRRIKKTYNKFINQNFHIIYGHTHCHQTDYTDGNLTISNSGTWLNTDEKGLIKIKYN